MADRGTHQWRIAGLTGWGRTDAGWQVCQLGDPADVLTWGELPDPEPGTGEVLVRVHAVACNFPDILLCQGRYQDKPPLPFTPGMEIAGEVVGRR